MINQFECHDDREHDKARFERDSTWKKKREARREKKRRETSHPPLKSSSRNRERGESLRSRARSSSSIAARDIYTLHGEIEIANNDATEQYALTLICIKGVRIVSISNAVYT